jgi:hypothetical protein
VESPGFWTLCSHTYSCAERGNSGAREIRVFGNSRPKAVGGIVVLWGSGARACEYTQHEHGLYLVWRPRKIIHCCTDRRIHIHLLSVMEKT